jgi:hypothetical protein
MPLFSVTVIEEVQYEVEVEADTQDEAEEAAVEMVCEEPDEWFDHVADRSATDTTELTAA